MKIILFLHSRDGICLSDPLLSGGSTGGYGNRLPRAGSVWFRCLAKNLRCGHLSGPSRTRGGFLDFEVGGHDGAYNNKGRVRVIVPFVGRKNGKLFDCQQSYNVLVLRVPGLEEGVKHCDRWLEHSFGCWARQALAGQTYLQRGGTHILASYGSVGGTVAVDAKLSIIEIRNSVADKGIEYGNLSWTA